MRQSCGYEMVRRAAPAVLLLLGVLGAGPAAGQARRTLAPGLVLEEHSVYYPVTGTTPEALHGELLQRGPRTDGKTFYGRTEWYLRWHFRYAPAAGGCRITEAEVVVTITMQLPEWRPGAAVPAALARQWSSFMRGLTLHEEGHEALALEAAGEVLRTLRGARAPSCGAMNTRANGSAEQVVAVFNERQRAYDRQTRHGLTQGARWPPAR